MKESLKILIEDYALYLFGILFVGLWYYELITGVIAVACLVIGILMILTSFYFDYRVGEEIQENI